MATSLPLRLLPIAILAACAAPRPAGAPTDAGMAVTDAYEVPPLAAGAPISAEEYARRRAALVGSLGDGVLVVLGAPNPELDYLPFSQSPEFHYLTGVTEPGAALVIAKTSAGVAEMLFVLPRDPSREVWEGSRLGAEGAEARTGIPSAVIAELVPTLDSLIPPAGALYALATPRESSNPLAVPSYQARVIGELAARYDVPVTSVASSLSSLRGVKSEAELDLIRRAIEITNLAHRAAMRTIQPEMNEFEIQALIEYTFRRHGADRPAFSSIVGSGPNATTLHYNANDRFMESGDMLVMDIGASYRGYAADVTRSVPVDGTFSPEQRDVYEIVLAAQKAAEAEARPGASWNQLNAAARAQLASGLARIGLIEAADATYDCGSEGSGRTCPQLGLFYMHGLGHGIGLEVHDPDASYEGAFRVGSAFSIEPGIYVRADALDHLPDTASNRQLRQALGAMVTRYQNIGVRIEDDYFITPGGVERVSDGAPREIEEIEALMALPGIGDEDRRAALVEWYRETQPRD